MGVVSREGAEQAAAQAQGQDGPVANDPTEKSRKPSRLEAENAELRAQMGALLERVAKLEEGGRMDPGHGSVVGTPDGRQDPQARIIAEGHTLHGNLINRDPRLKYHFANKGGYYDVAFFEGLGYHKVRYEPDGVALTMGQDSHEPGALIETMGQVLMAIDKERWEKMQAVVQGRADDVERGYLSNKAGEVDVVRGRHGQRSNVFRQVHGIRGVNLSHEMKTSTYTEQS